MTSDETATRSILPTPAEFAAAAAAAVASRAPRRPGVRCRSSARHRTPARRPRNSRPDRSRPGRTASVHVEQGDPGLRISRGSSQRQALRRRGPQIVAAWRHSCANRRSGQRQTCSMRPHILGTRKGIPSPTAAIAKANVGMTILPSGPETPGSSTGTICRQTTSAAVMAITQRSICGRARRGREDAERPRRTLLQRAKSREPVRGTD